MAMIMFADTRAPLGATCCKRSDIFVTCRSNGAAKTSVGPVCYEYFVLMGLGGQVRTCYSLRTLRIAVRDYRTEALLILSRRNERTDHRVLLADISERPAVYLSQPEEKPAHIRIAAQVAKVLRCYKCSIVLGIEERMIVDWVHLIVVGK